MIRILLLGSLLCGVAFSSVAQIYPSLPITPGHVPVWVQGTGPNNPILKDGGPAINGVVTEIGITNTGTPFCINDVPATNPTGYHQLCFGANALGGGLIAYNAYGGASPEGLNININGTTYPFPGTGNGNVVGAPPTVVGDFPVWNNTAGSLLKSGPGRATDTQSAPVATDGFTIEALIDSASPYTAQSIYRMTTFADVINYDGIRSVGVVPAGSTVTNIGQVSSYQIGLNPQGSGATSGNGVLFFGVGIAGANGVAEFGLNPILSDNTSYAVSSGTGRVLQNEFDFNVTSTDTVVVGLILQGASLSFPLASSGFEVNALGTGIPWQNAFITAAGASVNALVAGQNAAGNNSGSQHILLSSHDAAGHDTTARFSDDPNGVVEFLPVLPAGGVPLQVHAQMSTDRNIWFRPAEVATTGVNITSQDDGETVHLPLELSGSVVSVFGAFAPQVLLVSALPTCNSGQLGHIYVVTNANAPTYNATLTGGGSSYAQALCDGTSWKAH